MWKKISENLKQEDSFLSFLLKEQQWIFFFKSNKYFQNEIFAVF